MKTSAFTFRFSVTPGLVAGFTFILYLLFAITRFVVHEYDISAFIDASYLLVDAKAVHSSVRPTSSGFDGIFFYRLSLDPFTTIQKAFGIDLTDAPYRHQRILYPLLAWLLSGGGIPGLVPYALVLINLVMVSLIGWVGARLAMENKAPAWLGLGFSLYPGFVMTVARDLSEATATFFVLAGLFLLRKRLFAFAALALALAVLARETTLVVAAGIGISWLVSSTGKWRGCPVTGDTTQLSGQRTRWMDWHVAWIPWYVWVLPLVVYLGWQGMLWKMWGQIPLIARDGSDFGMPFAGFLTRLIDAALFWRGGDLVQVAARLVWFLECLLLLGLAAMVAAAFRSGLSPMHEWCAWMLFAMLASLMTWELWRSDQGFMRVTADYFSIGLLLLLGSRGRNSIIIAACAVCLWFPVAASRVIY
jgi:hypothetical protein